MKKITVLNIKKIGLVAEMFVILLWEKYSNDFKIVRKSPFNFIINGLPVIRNLTNFKMCTTCYTCAYMLYKYL